MVVNIVFSLKIMEFPLEFPLDMLIKAKINARGKFIWFMKFDLRILTSYKSAFNFFFDIREIIWKRSLLFVTV